MRVLLSTWGSRGDVEPLLGLALELRAQGVDVRMCAPPDFAERAGEVGVPFVTMGFAVRVLVASRPAPAEVAAALVAQHFDVIGKAAEDCDVVVATGLMPAGVRSVAEHLGIHYVLAGFHRVGIPSLHHPPGPRPGKPFPPGETDLRVLWKIDAERVDALYREPLNTHRAALGLPPVDNVRDHVFTSKPWLAVDPVLWPFEGALGFDVVQTGAWIMPDDRPLPADLVEFLEAGEPPVYVGFGSMQMASAPDAAAVAVEAIRAQGRRALVSRGWAGLALIDEKDDCFAVGEVNHRALFRRVAAVVHHGGSGTTTAAALAGAPQVIVPQIVDQPYWAQRVAELGIGAGHDGPTPTVESLSAALEPALRDETNARAKAVSTTIRTDGASVAARKLINLIDQGPE
ncbi:nucleotide disphospho-sugar-binding domain-containing protein [Pseudonocardia acidicola]|uniref:Glycosyltransferase family 1 protein n=1 Tax=Pseudonocardia acidicola TaxID=2724939 RepID=A0ABX1SCK4_9PSEU|nr:glycosyltransferase family 1 protein [Pseudonocardia acidicola]